VIRASAGAGKTFKLTGHYIRLLRAGADPATILATTFTRKAAGEILAKMLGRLIEATEDPVKRDALAKQTAPEPHANRDNGDGDALSQHECLELLRLLTDQMHRIAIATIDGFFHRIAQCFRFELELPLEPELTDETAPRAVALRQQAIAAMLADSDIYELLRLLRQLHHDASARSVSDALDQIVVDLHQTYRQAPRQALWEAFDHPGPLEPAALQQAIDALEAMEGELPATRNGSPNKIWRKAWANDLRSAKRGDWEAFISGGLAGKIAGDAESYGQKPIEQPWVKAYEPLIEHARAALLQREKDRHVARFKLLARFDWHYEALRRRHNTVLFSDLTHALARRMPELEPAALADIYFRLDSRVVHLLLDEFQDTSLDQWAVLYPFAEEIAAHGGSMREAGRSFFCVGDTKQAIYGWRGGCVELFDQLQQQLQLPGEAYESLSTSYRSTKPVLDAANAVFERIGENTVLSQSDYAADAEAGALFQDEYQPHEPADHLADVPGYARLETSTSDRPPRDEENDDEREGFTDLDRFAADRIRELYEAHPDQTIGVLVNTNKTAARLIYELGQLTTAAGQALPVSGEGGTPLTDTPAVEAVLSALTLADHPGPVRGRSAAAFHVAHSPLGAVVGLESTAPAAVQYTSRHIRRALLTEGYGGLINRWGNELAAHCDRTSLARLQQLQALAERYDPELTLRPSRFVQYVEATPMEQLRPAPIRVMTIHRAKGLEFDTVVLPELDRRMRDDFELIVQRQNGTGPVEAVHPSPKSELRQLSETLNRAHHGRRCQRRHEDLCNLYVALTRARRATHMIIRPPGRTSRGELAKPALSFAEILREALSPFPRHEEEGAQVLYEVGDPDWHHKERHAPASEASQPAAPRPRLASASGDAPRRAWRAVSPSTAADHGPVRASDLLNLSGETARHRGTLIHRWFEQVGFLDEDPVPSEAALRREARQLMPGVADDWLNRQIARFNDMLKHPEVATALKRQGPSDKLWREHDFALQQQGRLLQGRFDRVVLHYGSAGVLSGATLIDFKTDHIEEEELEEAKQAYQAQLNTYREALARLLSVEEAAIHPLLLFVEPGRAVALSSPFG
jgi:ATP-dependent exoDNAse (exonuclease V) beta subunit